ncbi:hypothetical protein [Kineosporia sp. NBRC 101731]|uniref:hypothetical protein n=1 Tax=Kineosporia sp. NBRC 101731 TaxID=3032199 RepID=UPI0024A554EE|nr:hypothetical protein [Kineosporia sp. NBRC 101731]GLY26834.1 hypothetical protein Kisp02_01990 [Kineosporia sp. NBRC 101731]
MPTIPWQNLDSTLTDDTEVVVMASRFQLHKLSQVPRFFLDAMKIHRQVGRSEGAVGISLEAHPLRREFFTLSAWRDQASIDAMIRQEPHRGAMSRHRRAMASSAFIFYRLPAGQLPAGWEDAHVRLAGNEAG